MPINGLSDIIIIPRLGKIHRGITREDGSPKAVRYFVLPGEKEVAEGKISAEVVKAMQEQYGKEPTELPIYIPCEDKELWAPQYLKRYSRSRGLTCKGTGGSDKGQVEVRLIDTDTGDFASRNTQDGHWTKIFPSDMECPGKECSEYINGRCKEVMCLQFCLPDVPGLGIWQLDTSSVNSIKNINACDFFIKKYYGRISGIPLLLATEPFETLTPQGRKQTVYVVHIRTKETMNQLLKFMLARVKLLEAGRSPGGQLDIPEAEEVEMPELLFPEKGEVVEEAPGEEPPESDEPFPAEGATKELPKQAALVPADKAPTVPAAAAPATDQEPAKDVEGEMKKLRQKVAAAWANVTGKKVDERKKWMKAVFQTDNMTNLTKDQLNDMYLQIQATCSGQEPAAEVKPAEAPPAQEPAAEVKPVEVPPAQAPAAEVKPAQGRNWKEMSNEQIDAACKELGYTGVPEQTKLRSELYKILHDLGYTTDEEKKKYLADLNAPPTRNMTKDQLQQVVEGVKKALEALKEAENIPDDI